VAAYSPYVTLLVNSAVIEYGSMRISSLGPVWPCCVPATLHGGYAMVVLANILHISLTIQLNSTSVTTFELYIDDEVDNDNNLYKWYEKSMGRMVHGTNGLHVVRIVRGTSSQLYEKSRHPNTSLAPDHSEGIN